MEYILSPKPQRRPLPSLLYKSFFYVSNPHPLNFQQNFQMIFWKALQLQLQQCTVHTPEKIFSTVHDILYLEKILLRCDQSRPFLRVRLRLPAAATEPPSISDSGSSLLLLDSAGPRISWQGRREFNAKYNIYSYWTGTGEKHSCLMYIMWFIMLCSPTLS